MYQKVTEGSENHLNKYLTPSATGIKRGCSMLESAS